MMKVLQLDVLSRRDRLRFVKAQWRFYQQDPRWVPPLIFDRMKLLDTRRNPFYKHSDIVLFLAEDRTGLIGRIAAIINEHHNRTHADRVGFFGFYESIYSQDVTSALLDAASEWLSNRGMTHIRGPVNPSMNDECGLLVEGFDRPPVILMPYNPPYYSSLLEGWGLRKVMDLYAYLLDQENYRSYKLERLLNVVRKRTGVTIRSMNFRNRAQFRRDVATLKELYNAAWEKNWGFVKMTDEEFDFLAADLKQVADENLVLIAEIGGRAVGFALALPDINECLIHNRSGHLLPGVWHIITKRNRITTVRIIVLGVLEQYRGSGIDGVLYAEIGERAKARGICWGEASWILETNGPMNNALQNTMHGVRYKTYRLYERPIALTGSTLTTP
jgi:GNAT superfamily N-acetyltransferase